MPSETRASPGRSSRKWLLAAVLLAALLQVTLLVRSPAVARDGMTFVTLARDFAKHPVGTMRYADQHPGFLAMILAGRWAVGPLTRPESILSWVWGARLAAGVFGLLVVVVAWLLARRTFDGRTAAVTAIIVTVLPCFRQSAADALSDTPHLFFYVLAAWLAAEGMIRRSWVWFPAAGAASGLAYWIRPEGLSVAMVAAVVLPLWAWGHRSMTPRKILLGVGALILSAVVVAMPYCVLSGKISGKITSKYYPAPAVSQGEAAAPGPVQVPAAAGHQRGFWEVLGAAITEIVWKAAQSLRWVLVMPFFVGVFAFRRPRTDQVPRPLIAALSLFHFLLLVWLYYTGGYVSYRHLMPALLLIMPWIACGSVLIAEKFASLFPEREGASAARRAGVILVVLLIALAAGLAPWTLRPLHSPEIPAVEAACWLAKRAQPGDTVLSNSPYVPFFAGMPGRVLTTAEALGGLDLSGIAPDHRYVILDARGRGYRPEWPSQLEGAYEPLEAPGVRTDRARIFARRSARPPER